METSNNINKLVLIDGDGLLYHSSKKTLEESIQSLNERIQNIFDKTEATHYVIFISYTPYFRHKLSLEYKLSRTKQKSNLKWIKTLKSFLVENWNAQSMNGVESDDLCSYWFNNQVYNKNHNIELLKDYAILENCEKIICSPDKDLLQSIPSKGNGHFNYSYKLEDKDNPESVIKGWWVETSEEEASNFKLWQLIAGDSSDNIITPFPENCANYVTEGDTDLLGILGGYIEGFDYRTPTGLVKFKEGFGISKGIYEFQKNYRLLHLLDCDEDFIREIGELPKFPIITQVPSKVEDKIDDELKF